MAHLIRMPKLSDDMQEGAIVEWFKRPGDSVEEGEPLFEVETDKANMEVECFYPGVLMSLDVKVGETVPIGTVIAKIAETDEEIKAAHDKKSLPAEEVPDKGAVVTAAVKAEPAETDETPIQETEGEEGGEEKQPSPRLEVVREQPRATPVAKRIAEEYGISLLEVHGSGPGGRIIKQDVEHHIREGKPKTSVAVPVTAQPLDQKRKYIVKKMLESKTTIPHYYLGVEVIMDEALRLRKQYNTAKSLKVSITDLILMASALALKRYPLANAHYEADVIQYSEQINIAVAVDTGEILLAPVVKNCESMTISELSATSRTLIDKARNKKLKPEDYEGGTFYISNIGNLGIEEIAPIIFPRTSSILGVGAIKKKPVVEDEEIAIRSMMKIMISADHRILDGARAGEFLMEIKDGLENPLRLLS